MSMLPAKHRAVPTPTPTPTPTPGATESCPSSDSVSTFQPVSLDAYHRLGGPIKIFSSSQPVPVSTADAESANSPTTTNSPALTSDGTTLAQSSVALVEENESPHPSTTEQSSSISLAPGTSGGSITASSGGGGNYKAGSDGRTWTPVVVGTSSTMLGAPAAPSSGVVSSSLLPDSGSNAGNTPFLSPTTHTASAAGSEMSTGAIIGVTWVCLLSLLALIVLIFQRRSIARRLELRRRWWFSRTPPSGSFSVVNRPHSPPGSDGGHSFRSSFATHFDQGLAFRAIPPSTFSHGIIPDLPPMAEVRERNSVLMSSRGTLMHRDSVYSLGSNGSNPDTPYLTVSLAQHGDDDGPPSPISVRPFSPSESFSFPKPPLLPQSDSPYAHRTRGSASSYYSGTTLVQVSTPPRAFMTDLPPPAPAPSAYSLQAQVTGTVSPVTAAAHASLDPFADPVKPDFADVEVIRRSFAPSMDDELAVYRGDRVRIVENFDDGWAIAEKLANSGTGYGMRQENRRGLIPIDCLREQGQPLPTFLAQKRMNSYGSSKEFTTAFAL